MALTRKRKIGVALALLAIILGLSVFAGRASIGQRLFERVVDANVGQDPSAKLPDGLHVYVCGSGSPLADTERAGPCLAVLAGREAFVFDAGSGSIRKLGRMGFPMDRLKAAFLTHLHSDHIDGVGELLLQAWIAGSRAEPLPVYGPEGTQRVIAGLTEAYSLDSSYRIAHHGPVAANPTGFGGSAMPVPLAEGQPVAVVYEAEGVRITVTHAIHDPVKPAYAYRIDYKGRSVTISGDTVYAPDIVALAKGSDVLFHEALNPAMVGTMQRALEKAGRKNTAKIMADIPGYHASPEDAARAASDAGVQALIYFHLVPSIPPGMMEGAFLGGARQRFGGTMRVSRDGMLVSLPAAGEAVNFDQLF